MKKAELREKARAAGVFPPIPKAPPIPRPRPLTPEQIAELRQVNAELSRRLFGGRK